MIQEITFHPLIEKMANKHEHVAAVVALLGAINANDLRRITLSDQAKHALITGLQHPNAKVRWWCLQYMDHLADESFVPHLLAMTQDPVGKVRRHAIHALTCDVCKPDGCALDVDPQLIPRLHHLWQTDADARVRAEARHALDKLATATTPAHTVAG